MCEWPLRFQAAVEDSFEVEFFMYRLVLHVDLHLGGGCLLTSINHLRVRVHMQMTSGLAGVCNETSSAALLNQLTHTKLVIEPYFEH